MEEQNNINKIEETISTNKTLLMWWKKNKYMIKCLESTCEYNCMNANNKVLVAMVKTLYDVIDNGSYIDSDKAKLAARYMSRVFHSHRCEVTNPVAKQLKIVHIDPTRTSI